MRVHQRVREDPGPDAGEAPEELEQEAVPGDVVGDAERDVAASLGQVQTEERLAVLVHLHVEHEQAVARGKLAGLRVARGPAEITSRRLIGFRWSSPSTQAI